MEVLGYITTFVVGIVAAVVLALVEDQKAVGLVVRNRLARRIAELQKMQRDAGLGDVDDPKGIARAELAMALPDLGVGDVDRLNRALGSIALSTRYLGRAERVGASDVVKLSYSINDHDELDSAFLSTLRALEREGASLAASVADHPWAANLDGRLTPHCLGLVESVVAAIEEDPHPDWIQGPALGHHVDRMRSEVPRLLEIAFEKRDPTMPPMTTFELLHWFERSGLLTSACIIPKSGVRRD